jgi:regulation of enolase protein 1 (concanavalin A-like superfamily)
LYRFGRLEQARDALGRAEALSSALGGHPHLEAESALLRGQLALSRGEPEEALASFRQALAAEPGEQWEWLLRFLLGCTLLAQGRRKEAARSFLAVLGSTLAFRLPPAYSLTVDLAHVVSLLEECHNGGDAFLAACDLVRRKRPQARDLLGQWYLGQAEIGARTPADEQHSLGSLGPEWTWHDPYEDCAHRLQDGLVVSAAVGRGLWGSNLAAPRLLRPVSGDFAVQVACDASGSTSPCVGGLVLWRNGRNYLRLDRGAMGSGQLMFSGCIGNRHTIIGRGRLGPGRIVLRLERRGAAVRALCSADGERWSTAGQAELPVEDTLEVGLFADGAIRPEIYPRSYQFGSEIRFTGFALWR